MVTNLAESIFVFILFALIPAVAMMLSGVVGPLLILIGLMFVEYVLIRVEDKKND